MALLVMGDFNDEPEDLSLTQHAGSTNNKENVISDNFDRKKGGPLLYNLARYYIHRSFQDKKGRDRVISGTYYFKNTKEGRVDANVLDQLLVSRGLLGKHLTLSVDLDSARIEAFPEQIGLGEFPFPNRFGLPKNQVKPDGFSDHYPVSVVILER